MLGKGSPRCPRPEHIWENTLSTLLKSLFKVYLILEHTYLPILPNNIVADSEFLRHDKDKHKDYYLLQPEWGSLHFAVQHGKDSSGPP